MLSKRERVILFATVAVIGFAVIFNLLLYPFFNKSATLSKEIAITKQKLKKYAFLLSQKEAINKKYSVFLSQQKSSQDTDTLVSALSELEAMAKETNIRIIDIRPETLTRQQGPYKEALIELRAESDAQGFLKFMYRIGNSLSLLTVRKFQLSSRANAVYLEGRFTIRQVMASE